MDEANGVTSAAAVRGHPLHPMVVPFPIAFLIAGLGADLAFWGTGDPFWARAALWLVGAGFFTALAAAALGLVDFLRRASVRQLAIAWAHALGNATVAVLALASWLLRLGGAEQAVLPWGLALSVFIALILAVTGWLGGELSYRHKIGLAPDAHAPGEAVNLPPGRGAQARG